jgi:hypothetical protein
MPRFTLCNSSLSGVSAQCRLMRGGGFMMDRSAGPRRAGRSVRPALAASTRSCRVEDVVSGFGVWAWLERRVVLWFRVVESCASWSSRFGLLGAGGAQEWFDDVQELIRGGGERHVPGAGPAQDLRGHRLDHARPAEPGGRGRAAAQGHAGALPETGSCASPRRGLRAHDPRPARRPAARLDGRCPGRRPAALRSFVNGLRHDLAAVTARLTLPWSNGPPRAQSTRSNSLKRQCFGRADFR